MRTQISYEERYDSLRHDGDMNHPVWQTAYAAAYAKVFVATANDDPNLARKEYHSAIALATEVADAAYNIFVKMGGNETAAAAKKKKYPEGESYEWGTVEVVKETEKALKVKKPGGDDDDGEWVPKSQIHSKSEVMGDGDEGMLMVSQWFADQKNLTENGQAKEDKVPF